MNSEQHVTLGWLFHSWYHQCCFFHHTMTLKSLILSDSQFLTSCDKWLKSGAVIALLILEVRNSNHPAYCLVYFFFKGPGTFKILNFPLLKESKQTKLSTVFLFFTLGMFLRTFTTFTISADQSQPAEGAIHSIK